MKKVLAICGVLASIALPAAGGERVDKLRMAVTPLRSFAPSTVTIRVRIEPSDDNRALTVVIDGEAFYRSSQISLNGDQAQRTVFLQYQNVPGGAYEIYGMLTDRSGRQRALVSQSVEVLSTTGQ